MSNYVIAADIGNTNTHVGLINCASRFDFSLDVFPSNEIDKRFIDSITTLSQSMKHASPVPVVISNVIATIEQRFSDPLSSSVEDKVFWVRYHEKLPVCVRYHDPLRLGADRLVNCFTAATSRRARASSSSTPGPLSRSII